MQKNGLKKINCKMEHVATIVTTILGLIFTPAFFILLMTWRATKKKTEAEAQTATTGAEKTNIELATEAVNKMLESVNQLMETNSKYLQTIEERNTEIFNLKAEKMDNTKRINALERKLNKMQKTISQVLNIVESLPIDDKSEKQVQDIKNLLKDVESCEQNTSC